YPPTTALICRRDTYTNMTIILVSYLSISSSFFFINPPPTPIYTLSLHDALPIYARLLPRTVFSPFMSVDAWGRGGEPPTGAARRDRKSTRLNSSHDQISYAVFCLKKKKHRGTPPIAFPLYSPAS